ncbi:MAG: UDP-N-acetylglucosamine 2-epimerase (non-hydrolyzing) [Marinobacter sp.]|nr:MAG: UDP-N-acetylglucosamine 2-epimerase (non-hydrolyzing) [Marinobacter sp.]
MKLLTVIGARPQIIKAAALSRAVELVYSAEITEKIVHTGQHYDDNMSRVFFDEMNIPKPDYNLKVGSGAHGKQTASMIKGLEEVMIKESPDAIVVYGDTNSTLAAAITGSKLHIPIMHVEAGLRSFNKSMPEEINRIICDHVSTLLFAPTEAGYFNLISEGFKEGNDGPYTVDNPKIYHCGDVMYDNIRHFLDQATSACDLFEEFGISKGEYLLATIHRDNNTDDPKRLTSIFKALNRISEEMGVQVVLPMHPRTSKLIKQNLAPEVYKQVKANEKIIMMPAVSYLGMLALEESCKMIVTDSGGVQKEAYLLKKPCIILRAQTEWVELVDNGNAVLTDSDENRIVEAYSLFLTKTDYSYPDLFGDGKAAIFICKEIVDTLSPAN